MTALANSSVLLISMALKRRCSEERRTIDERIGDAVADPWFLLSAALGKISTLQRERRTVGH